MCLTPTARGCSFSAFAILDFFLGGGACRGYRYFAQWAALQDRPSRRPEVALHTKDSDMHQLECSQDGSEMHRDATAAL